MLKTRTLLFQGKVRLSPPSGDSISAVVNMEVAGGIDLDDRPGEAFKPLTLPSMNVSDEWWDTQSAFVASDSFVIPASGFLIPVNPGVFGSQLGLHGGTSCWKVNAPTIEVTLDEPLQITGWVDPDFDPNNDNVSFWAASDEVLPSWQYTVTAKPHSGGIVCICGDVHPAGGGDMDVDVLDALRTLKMAVGQVGPSAGEQTRGDVHPDNDPDPDGDGDIDVLDVLRVLKASVGLVTITSCGGPP